MIIPIIPKIPSPKLAPENHPTIQTNMAWIVVLNNSANIDPTNKDNLLTGVKSNFSK